MTLNLEAGHRDSLRERGTLPDEPQPVKVPDWNQEPGNGAIVVKFNRMWSAQWRDSKGKLDMQGHDRHWDAITNALRITEGRKGRRAASWTAARERFDDDNQDQDPTGKRVA